MNRDAAHHVVEDRVAPGSGKMKPGTRLALAFALMAISNGCAMNNVDPGFSLTGQTQTGVVVVALTQTGLPKGFDMLLEFRGVGHPYRGSLAVSDRLYALDWPCPISKISNTERPCGRLAVVELPPGEYEFFSWRAGSHHATTSYSTTVRSREKFPLRFQAEAGKAVYLGNIEFSVRGGFFDMRVTDMRNRDLTLLRRRNPKIKPEQLRVAIIS
ncbi:MAG: hypothetical protein MI919_16830 [Holophagales bacterium]|nr:hypothetical protein [Holophagales bacterium]